MRGTGVTVTALCPGPTASGVRAAADLDSSRLVASRKLPPPASVARAGCGGMRAGKVVVVPGASNRLLAASVRVTPRPVIRRILHRVQQPR